MFYIQKAVARGIFSSAGTRKLSLAKITFTRNTNFDERSRATALLNTPQVFNLICDKLRESLTLVLRGLPIRHHLHHL